MDIVDSKHHRLFSWEEGESPSPLVSNVPIVLPLGYVIVYWEDLIT